MKLSEVPWDDLKVGDKVRRIDGSSGVIVGLIDNDNGGVLQVSWHGHRPMRIYAHGSTNLEYLGRPTVILSQVPWADLKVGDRLRHADGSRGVIAGLSQGLSDDYNHIRVDWMTIWGAEWGTTYYWLSSFCGFIEYLGRAEPEVGMTDETATTDDAAKSPPTVERIRALAQRAVPPASFSYCPTQQEADEWHTQYLASEPARRELADLLDPETVLRLLDEEVTAKLWEHRERIKELEAQVMGMREQNKAKRDAHLEKFNKLNAYVTEQDDRIVKLKAELATTSKQYEEVHALVARQDARIQKLIEALALKNTETAKLQTELAATHKFHGEDADLAEARIHELTGALTFYRDVWAERPYRNSIDVLLDDRGKVATKALQTTAAAADTESLPSTEPERHVQITVQDQRGYPVFVEKITFDIEGVVCGTVNHAPQSHASITLPADEQRPLRVTVVAYNGDTQIAMLPVGRDRYIFAFFFNSNDQPR